VASAYVDRWIMLLGLVYIFIVMFVPGGIVAGLDRLVQRVRKTRAAPPSVAEPAAPEAASTEAAR